MRKIMKFQWGNSLLRQGMGSITPLQSSSDLYTAMTGLQSANFDKFSPANNPLLQAGAASGDMASKALLMNANTNKAVNGLSKSAANMATGTAGSTVKPGGGLFSKANIGNTMSKAGGYADMIGSFIPKKEQSALTTGLNQGYDAAANMISSVPGVGTIVGGAMKIGGMLSDGLTALGVGTDQMTTTDKILDSKFMKLTPMGLVNAFGAKKADTIYKDNETWESQGSAYGGSMAKVDDALTKSGKKYGAFSNKARKKANRQIAEAKRQQNAVSDINEEARDAFQSQAGSIDRLNRRNALSMAGGYQSRGMRIGRVGVKLPTQEEIARVREFLASRTKKFAEGGKMNVIPDGALHAHKNHMNVDGITHKGIPVITEEDGGVIQHAEIERNEIIFTKEVTEKLEALAKKGTDEAAIEAGKILAREIIENTQDNTGLMREVTV